MRFTTVFASLLAVFVAAPLNAVAQVPETPTSATIPLSEQPVAQAVAPAPVSTSPTLTKVDLEAWLDGFVPYAIRRGDIPGAVVVVVKDGQPLLEKGYGYADVAERKPVDPASTMFRPGSVSKLFTWTAVMQLVEQGKIDLDADIETYLDFKIPPRDGKPITMRNIMTHTSGIEETARGLITSNPKDSIELGNYVKHWVPTRIFAPGETPSYSNYATTLAGYIVQRVSGQTFDEYVEQHIFAPLDMQHASFRQPLPDALLPLMSKGYKPGDDKPHDFEIVNPAPAGSLAATGQDMGHFMIAHLQNGAFGGQRILSEATAVQMHSTALDILPSLNRMVLGFYENNINGHRVIAHAGDTQWFHSDLYLFLDDGVGLFVSFNSPGKEGVAGKIRSDLFKQFANRYLPGPIPEGTVDAATAKEHAQQMVGVYENSRRSNDSFTSLANLAGQTKVVLTKDGDISVPDLKDLGGESIKWREIAPYVWRDINSGDRLAAKVVDGKVQRFSVEPISPFMLFDRVPGWKSSAWLVPAFMVALVALLLTVLAWPVSALVRRYYKTPYRLSGIDLKAHRTVRFASLFALLTMIGAIYFLSVLLGDFNNLDAGNDWIVSLLRIAAFFVLPIATLAAAWNAVVVIRSNRRWTAKLWSIVLFLSCLTLTWVAFAFGLAGFGANY